MKSKLVDILKFKSEDYLPLPIVFPPREYKVMKVTTTEPTGIQELEQALNNDWAIDRVDNAGNSFYIIYVLSKTKTLPL